MANESQEKLRSIRTLPNLVLEDVVLTISIYAVLALYCAQLIGFFCLQAALLLYVIRVFALRHERAHLPGSSSRTWWQKLPDWIEVYHSPYQEPFSEKRRKHLLHHSAHTGHRKFSKIENGHDWLEGSLPKAILSSAFYHELMLGLDLLRERRLSRTRLISLAVSTAMIVLTIALAGWANFLAFFIAYRIASFVAWFSFSYLLHVDFMYEHELGPKLPTRLKAALELTLGRGAVTAIFYHKFHHENPREFHEFSMIKKADAS